MNIYTFSNFLKNLLVVIHSPPSKIIETLDLSLKIRGGVNSYTSYWLFNKVVILFLSMNGHDSSRGNGLIFVFIIGNLDMISLTVI